MSSNQFNITNNPPSVLVMIHDDGTLELCCNHSLYGEPTPAEFLMTQETAETLKQELKGIYPNTDYRIATYCR